MVGVPGRSKACNTCLKRKIKCDLAKPYCANCTKSRRACGGYTRKTAYVFDDNVKLVDTAAPDDGTVTYQGRWKGPSTHGSKSGNIFLHGLPHGTRPPLPKRRLKWTSEVSDSDPDSPGASGDVPARILNTARIASLPSISQQLHDIFLYTYMPRDGTGGADNAKFITGNWLLQLRGRSCSLPALQTSVAAYASAQIGRQNNDMNVVARSIHLYLRALEELRTALSDPATRLNDETIATCLTLGIYELTENPIIKQTQGSTEFQYTQNNRPDSKTDPRVEKDGVSAYRRHMEGAMMLLKLRGPDASNTPLAHSLFLGLRRQTVVTTLVKHTDTFLSHDDWRERPWSKYPKTLLDSCLDSILDLPVLQRLCDTMEKETEVDTKISQCQTIIKDCNTILASMEAWHAAFAEYVAGPTHWSKFSGLESEQDDPVLGKPFPVSYWFPTFSIAYMSMTFWSAVMVTHWLLFVACRTLQRFDVAPADLGEEDLSARIQRHRDTWVAMARNICQMTEYYLSDGMGTISLAVTLAMLEGARAMFRDGTDDWARELAWIGEMIVRGARRLNTKSMVD